MAGSCAWMMASPHAQSLCHCLRILPQTDVEALRLALSCGLFQLLPGMLLKRVKPTDNGMATTQLQCFLSQLQGALFASRMEQQNALAVETGFA